MKKWRKSHPEKLIFFLKSAGLGKWGRLIEEKSNIGIRIIEW
jgi:hypothetical protein